MKIRNRIISTVIATSLIIPCGCKSIATDFNPQDFITINKFSGATPDIKATSDGGYVISYNTNESVDFTNNGGADGVIEKFNSKGKREWIKNWGSSIDDSIYAVEELSSGNFVAVAYANSPYSDVDGVETEWIGLKFSSNGELLMAKYLELPSYYNPNAYSKVGLKKCDEGFIFYNGGTIIKYDESLNKVSNIERLITGDSNFDDIIEDNDGNLMTVSTYSEFLYGYAGTYFRKFDKDTFDMTFEKKGDLEDNTSNVYQIYDLEKLEDGSFVGVGITNYEGNHLGGTNLGDYDIAISKITSEGVVEKTVSFGTSGKDYGLSMVSTKDGGFMVLATYDSNGNEAKDYLVKLNSDLDIEWEQEIVSLTAFEYKAPDMSEIVILNNGSIVGIGLDSANNLYKVVYNDIMPDPIVEAIENVEANPTEEAMIYARRLVNEMPEGDLKEEYQARLNAIEIEMGFVKKNSTANVDVYIKSENMLKLSLDTNSIMFEDFSGVTSIEKPNALKLTVSSSLPYQVDAYLATEIQNSAKNKNMNKEILKIKANAEAEDKYESFVDVNQTPITLLDDQQADNNVEHGIDFKLEGGKAFDKDVYKTTIKFEVKQK